jgi:imidazoleglycerol-phosphate dehydratase
MKKRQAKISRKTKETAITGKLVIDGIGKTSVKTGIGFLDHMLDLFTFHGLFDLEINAKGDLNVDIHHTNEDLGICLGKAFKEALADCAGINRMGSAEVPMDEARAKVVIDISGRYAFVWKRGAGLMTAKALQSEGYSLADGKDFLDTFAKNANINLHVEIYSEDGDVHHTLEAIFKAFGKAMDQATQIDPRRKEVPSTKGII